MSYRPCIVIKKYALLTRACLTWLELEENKKRTFICILI